MYYLITYRWRLKKTPNYHYDHMVYNGSITKWLLLSIKQPEDWKLINSEKITYEEFSILKDHVDMESE